MAENIEPGSRVRVSFEGTYVRSDSIGDHVIDVAGARQAFSTHAPSDATIQVISAPAPVPDEPKGLGAVVRIDGHLCVRADADSEPWRRLDGEWKYWSQMILDAKVVKVESPGIEVPQ